MKFNSKALLLGYKALNLGDDLFFKHVLERYENTLFIMVAPRIYKMYFSKYNNLIIINEKTLLIRLLTKIDYLLGITHVFSPCITLNFYLSIRFKFNVILTLGGSIFMEGIDKGENLLFDYKLLKKQYNYSKLLILGCNFGPSTSLQFKENISSIIKIVDDVCFRDFTSFNIFNYLNNVRFGNDIVFHNAFSVKAKQNKTLGISLINFEKRISLLEFKKEYIKKNIEIINYYKTLGYKIVLISFCKEEGDEEIIKEVILNLNDTKDVSSIFYYGNISKTIDIIKSFEIVIATRFHAIVLGLLFEIKVFPIAYNNKAKDMLISNNLWKEEYDLKNFINCDIRSLSNFFIYNYNINSKNNTQFNMLDKILNCTNKTVIL